MGQVAYIRKGTLFVTNAQGNTVKANTLVTLFVSTGPKAVSVPSVVGQQAGVFAQQGLGTLIAQAQGNFNPDGVYAGLVVTTVLAIAAEGVITAVERRLLRWRPPRRALEAEP